MLAVCGHEHHSRGELQVLQRVGQLQAGRLGHVHVQEHDVAGVFLQLLDGLADAGRFGDHLRLPQLFQQVLQFRACRCLVIDDHGLQHPNLQSSLSYANRRIRFRPPLRSRSSAKPSDSNGFRKNALQMFPLRWMRTKRTRTKSKGAFAV